MSTTFMNSPRLLFTSESVTEGHPDKMCDQISDAVLDACFAQDPYSRVACETATKTGYVMLLGEITTKARINFDELGGTQIVLATAATLNPVSVLDLVVGALAGSVERGEPEDVDGVRVTRFDSNLSLDRSVTELDLPDDELEPRLLMFRLLGIFDDVRPARYWLDEDGRVRRVEAELLQRVSRRQQHELNVTLEITGYGTPIEVPVPGAEETITFERHGRLVRTVAPGDA